MSAHGTGRVRPPAKALAMEGVVAQNRHDSRHVRVQPLQADGAHRQLDRPAQLAPAAGHNHTFSRSQTSRAQGVHGHRLAARQRLADGG
eukprot:scaffold23481_cov45-Isochrysis_galbana.AAC.1